MEKSMNNLYPNSGIETEAGIAQSHQSLFSRPRPIREKGVACESIHYYVGLRKLYRYIEH